MIPRRKEKGHSTWRAVEERELSQAIFEFMKVQLALKTILNTLEPKRPKGPYPSPFSQHKRKRSIIGAPACYSNPKRAQQQLLKALDEKAQQLNQASEKNTGHCVTEPVQHKEKSK